jgi:hypothetical protein
MPGRKKWGWGQRGGGGEARCQDAYVSIRQHTSAYVSIRYGRAKPILLKDIRHMKQPPVLERTALVPINTPMNQSVRSSFSSWSKLSVCARPNHSALSPVVSNLWRANLSATQGLLFPCRVTPSSTRGRSSLPRPTPIIRLPCTIRLVRHNLYTPSHWLKIHPTSSHSVFLLLLRCHGSIPPLCTNPGG